MHEAQLTSESDYTQSQLAIGVRLFAMAKETSQYIGGPTQVIVAHKGGMEVNDREDMRVFEGRVNAFNKIMAELILTFPEHTLNEATFNGLLEWFKGEIGRMRGRYIMHTEEDEGVRSELLTLDKFLSEAHEVTYKLYDKMAHTRDATPTLPSESEPSDSQTSEDRQSPYTAEYPETDRNASDD